MKMPYTDLAAKHGLPDLAQWMRVDDPVSLQDVRKHFQDKLFGYADYVYTILHPEELTSMLESQVFADSERTELEALYREMVLLGKDCQIADMGSTDEEEAELLQRIAAAWPPIVQRMKHVLTKTKGAYSDDAERAHHLSYLG